jgi:two-component system response regulator AlgR
MLNILIVDDEAPARSRLRRMLGDVPAVHIAGEAASSQEALSLISTEQPDVLLLDISMPGMDGMSLAKMLQQKSPTPAVIFCTAWSDQAVEAFACDAVDYLVKPVRQERLEKALEKARLLVSTQSEPADKVMLRSTLGGKVSLLPLTDVIYFFAEDKYTTVIHDEGQLMISQTLLELEQQHADFLIRTHRSTLVVKDRIRGLEKSPRGSHKLVLDGTNDRPLVSRRNLASIRKVIREFS